MLRDFSCHLDALEGILNIFVLLFPFSRWKLKTWALPHSNLGLSGIPHNMLSHLLDTAPIAVIHKWIFLGGPGNLAVNYCHSTTIAQHPTMFRRATELMEAADWKYAQTTW